MTDSCKAICSKIKFHKYISSLIKLMPLLQEKRMKPGWASPSGLLTLEWSQRKGNPYISFPFFFLSFFVLYVYMQFLGLWQTCYSSIFTFLLQSDQVALIHPLLRCLLAAFVFLRLLGFRSPEFCLLWFNDSADLCPHDCLVASILTLPPSSLHCLLLPLVDFKNSSRGPIAFSSATSLANPFWSTLLLLLWKIEPFTPHSFIYYCIYTDMF